ncbi:MAG: S8 family serine peptidase [Planctomycetota bacterium]
MHPITPLLLLTLGGSPGSSHPSIEQRIRVDASTEVTVFVESGTRRAAVTRDHGQTWRTLPPVDHRLRLRLADFDPLLDGPPPIPDLLHAAPDHRLHIVQFATPIIAEYRAAVRRAGAQALRHSYLPTQSLVVRADAHSAQQLATLPFVRWVGADHPAYRTEPELVAALATGTDLAPAAYDVLLFDQRGDEHGFEAFVRQVGGTVEQAGLGGGLVRAHLDTGALLQVLHHDAVLWLDRHTPIGTDNDHALTQSGARRLHGLPIPIDGKGMTCHQYESLDAAHPEFAALPPYRTTPLPLGAVRVTNHGTNTAGQIISRGVHPTNPDFRGFVPFAQIHYTQLSSGNRYDLYRQLVDPTGGVRALATTAGWGGSRTTFYTSQSAAVDTALLDHDLFSTQSQAAGPATQSRPEAWSKNNCSVGGFLHFDNPDPSDDAACAYCSVGPAADGRIGVTLTGYADLVETTAMGGGYVQNFGGTSSSAPMVNGLGQLAIEIFTDGMLGYPGVSWQDRFDARPRFTTTKAMLMATSRQLIYSQANRFEQGWGFPNVGDLYDLRDQILIIDEDRATTTGPSRDVLSQGGRRSYVVFVPPGTPELRAAMTYADVAGNPAAQNQHRVNDLDLEVIAPDGTRYPGNHGLRVGPTSLASSTETENKDTEEMVILTAPVAPGAWTVSVSATEVLADTHAETAAQDADYALVVRGIGGGRDTSGLLLDVVSDAPGDLRIGLSNVPATGWATGYTFFSADTSRLPSLGNWFGIELDALTLAGAVFPPTAGGLFAFTPSANPSLYPNATFAMPQGIAIAVAGLELDATVLLYDGSGNAVAASNVDRVRVR